MYGFLSVPTVGLDYDGKCTFLKIHMEPKNHPIKTELKLIIIFETCTTLGSFFLIFQRVGI